MKCYAKSCIALLSLAVVLAGCETTQTSARSRTATQAASSSEAVRATVEIQGLREELASLRNEIELQRNQLENLQRRQRELYDDLDYRLRQRERLAGEGGDLATRNVPPAGPGDYGSNTGSGFGGTDSDAAAGMTGDASAGAGAGSRPVTEVVVAAPGQQALQPQAAIATPEEQTLYDEAFSLLKQSRYGESVASFEQLLQKYPYGALADDAQYWIGEAMYVTRDFQGGLRAFRNVVDRYPESARVAEAMLKLGYIQYEIGAKEDARQTLTQVVNRFPGSRVAISAQTRLRKLEAEGG